MDKWHEIISTKESEGVVTIDVHSWLSKATLDAYVGKSRTSICGAHRSENSIGAAAFDYDFGAVENAGNKFTKSYTNMTCGTLPPLPREPLTIVRCSFAAFGRIPKEQILLMDSLKWAPADFATWLFEWDKRPGMVNLRENKTYAHEVAAKLVEEKRQELKDGTSRKDLLSLLGSS